MLSNCFFGRNTAAANDYYQTLHEINHGCLYDSIKQALKQNFELLLINCNRGDEPVYKFADSMNNLVLCGKLNVTVSNHNGFSDDDVDYIEGVADDVMTNNVDKVTDITWYAML